MTFHTSTEWAWMEQGEKKMRSSNQSWEWMRSLLVSHQDTWLQSLAAFWYSLKHPVELCSAPALWDVLDGSQNDKWQLEFFLSPCTSVSCRTCRGLFYSAKSSLFFFPVGSRAVAIPTWLGGSCPVARTVL